MRWRIHDIPADVRKAARDAAKAAGLPLGPWLARTILQSEGRSSAASPVGDGANAISSATDEPATAPLPALMDSEPARVDDVSPLYGTDDQTIAGAEMTEAAAQSRRASRLLASPRAKLALAAAAVIAIVAGAITLWHFSSPARDAQQAADSSAQSPLPAHVESAAPPAAPPPSLAEIIEGLRRDAQNGDAMAQHDLALAYLNGRGVAQNYQTAADWFEKAAAAGLERAQFNLAVLYENALGVPEDLERAFTLYSAAAEQGFGLAQHNLAVAYAQGRGTSRDYRAAALWFRRAADQGIASAQFNLGMIYEKGLAGAPDEPTAYGWYRMAAASGSEAAVARLAAIEGRIAAPPAEAKPGARAAKPTATEIAEIQRLLAQLSFNPGTADGKPGKATREAIRHYQQVAGLPVNGEPSKDLLTHLRQVTNMMESRGR